MLMLLLTTKKYPFMDWGLSSFLYPNTRQQKQIRAKNGSMESLFIAR
nr:MAG TPA: hypothetical protein [Caudoviricetes sp.]